MFCPSNNARLMSAHIEDDSQILRRRGYKLGRLIGCGSYGKVHQAFRFASSGEQLKIACKVIDHQKVSRDFIVKFLPREIDIARHVHHVNLVKFYDILNLSGSVYIFMEFCSNGDLLQFIHNNGALHENQARHFFRQLVGALQYLHSLDIAHRDLKCENILLTSGNVVKITDFGFSRRMRDGPDDKLSDTFCGSMAYAAPEVLYNRPYEPKLSDVWSLGCVLHVMLTAVLPFGDTNYKRILFRQRNRLIRFDAKNATETITDDAEKLIRSLLEPVVKRRMTLDRACAHSWLKKYVGDVQCKAG